MHGCQTLEMARQWLLVVRTYLLAVMDSYRQHRHSRPPEPLLSPLTTLYRAGCRALWPQLIPEYLLVKDLHGPPLGSLCSLCQWMGMEGSLPFLPNLSLWTSLDNSLTECIVQRPAVFLQRQRKSGLKLHGR